MLNRFLSSIGAMVVLLAFSSVTFAQTYGTKGYAPGAWKPDELPKDLAKPKPFDAHDLSAVWSMPTRPGYFERHSLNDKWLDIKDKSVPDQMRSEAYPPPMTPWGKANSRPRSLATAREPFRREKGNDAVSTCEPMGYPRDLWEANLRPFEFIQTPDRVLQHMQFHDLWRTIWTDGRQLPEKS